MRGKAYILLPAIVVAALLLASTGAAQAHGKTTAGRYALEIGFHEEPAIQGQPNSLDLVVTDQQTGEKINGLEKTLKAEVIFGSSKKTLRLEPQEDEEGAYSAYLIPTRAGDYTWHISGFIQNQPVDVSMTSSPDTFSSVEPASTYNFPDQSGGEGVSAQTALVVGIAGVLLGLAGILAGLAGWRAARARRS